MHHFTFLLLSYTGFYDEVYVHRCATWTFCMHILLMLKLLTTGRSAFNSNLRTSNFFHGGLSPSPTQSGHRVLRDPYFCCFAYGDTTRPSSIPLASYVATYHILLYTSLRRQSLLPPLCPVASAVHSYIYKDPWLLSSVSVVSAEAMIILRAREIP